MIDSMLTKPNEGAPAASPLARHSSPSPVPSAQGSAAGVTLIELVIASVLVLVLAYLVMTLSKSGVDAQDYAKRMGRVTEITQDLTETFREEVQSSVRIFSNDATGTAYLDLIDLVDLPAPLEGSRLPTIDEDGVFEPEAAGGTETGNALLLARYAWSDEFVTTSSTTYRIDVYRFVYMYLTPIDGGPSQDNPYRIDLVHWVGEPLADGNQIDNITDIVDQAEVLEHLRTGSADSSGNTHDPITAVWKVGESPATADTLRQILSGGALTDDQEAPRTGTDWMIFRSDARTNTGLLDYRHHSIASIWSASACGVGRFGDVTTSDAGFPHGFEIQAVGPSSARQVLLGLSVASTLPGRLAYHRSQIVTDARDL